VNEPPDERTPPAGRRGIVGVALSLGLAVGVFGVSFGILARAAGFGIVAPIVMSAVTFAGSAQFAAVSVIGTGGAVVAAIVAAILLNSRYLPIGLSVAPSLSGSPGTRLLEAQMVVDESWAVSARGDGTFDVRALLTVGLTLYAAWVVGTTIGVFGAGALGDPARFGLDAAFPALFLALLVPQVRPPRHAPRDSWRRSRALHVALLGGGIAFVLIPFTPAGVPIIAASAACLLGIRRG
jgi:4-azaleucine resistance transporter AzlC